MLIRRLFATAICSLALVVAVTPTVAQALDPSGPVVLEFSNEACTDPLEEDADIKTALEGISASVTLFDGGSGDAAAWTAALSGVDVLVFPEGCNFDTAYIDDSAEAVIKTWIESGKTVVGTGSYRHAEFINFMTGLNFTSEFNNNNGVSGESAVWNLQTSSGTLPQTIPNGNYTGGLVGFSTWSAEKKAFVTPIYYNQDQDNLGVAYFKFGSGYYIYNAYDWYPDSEELANGVRAAWDQTLQFAATGQIAPPTATEPTEPTEPTQPTTPPSSAPAAKSQLPATGPSHSNQVAVAIALMALGIGLAKTFRTVEEDD